MSFFCVRVGTLALFQKSKEWIRIGLNKKKMPSQESITIFQKVSLINETTLLIFKTNIFAFRRVRRLCLHKAKRTDFSVYLSVNDYIVVSFVRQIVLTYQQSTSYEYPTNLGNVTNKIQQYKIDIIFIALINYTTCDFFFLQ